jgi:hypothetical protein
MIWGETFDHRKARMLAPHLWFAWRPIRLVTGEWAWLTNVMRVWWDDKYANYAYDSSRWVYSREK